MLPFVNNFRSYAESSRKIDKITCVIFRVFELSCFDGIVEYFKKPILKKVVGTSLTPTVILVYIANEMMLRTTILLDSSSASSRCMYCDYTRVDNPNIIIKGKDVCILHVY